MSVHGKIINPCILLHSFFCWQLGLLIVDQVVFNSTLVLFACDPEGIYDHLTSLSQAKLSSEISKIVDDLIKNHPRLAEVVGSKFDFGFIELFNSVAAEYWSSLTIRTHSPNIEYILNLRRNWCIEAANPLFLLQS